MARRTPDYTRDTAAYLSILQVILTWSVWSEKKFVSLQKKFTRTDGSVVSKTELLTAYDALSDQLASSPTLRLKLRQWIQMKPTRTISGVAPVTVLTKPFPCPGKCIFCPNDIRMPKSYLSDEPGAQRAEKNYFDPYLQTYNRLQALKDMGHSTAKIELIILGGTWSYYPEPYQRWFIHECFRAMNEFGKQDDRIARRALYEKTVKLLQSQHKPVMTDKPSENIISLADYQITAADTTYNQVVSKLYTKPEKELGLDTWQTNTWEELKIAQDINESGETRCVGLVIETRPDNISEAEVMKIRRLGCTKTQIGVQSLQDDVLEKNHRGHDVAATRKAFKLLRLAGFKIHAHWMPNLYGSTPKADIADYVKLFTDPDFKPDELKIYPCSLIESAELMNYYRAGKWRPYTEPELMSVLIASFKHTPPYCRLTRVIRDIPSPDIVVGNKKTNFRQLVDTEMLRLGAVSQEIRAREIREQIYDPATVKFSIEKYDTSVSQELFLQFTAQVVDQPDQPAKLLAFLRLSLPTTERFIPELKTAAMIREVHVYGRAADLGKRQTEHAQHAGFGTQLMVKARELAAAAGFKQLAVISAIGTREYYRSRGFTDGELYQFLACD
jgi:elongator complex protein 3